MPASASRFPFSVRKIKSRLTSHLVQCHVVLFGFFRDDGSGSAQPVSPFGATQWLEFRNPSKSPARTRRLGWRPDPEPDPSPRLASRSPLLCSSLLSCGAFAFHLLSSPLPRSLLFISSLYSHLLHRNLFSIFSHYLSFVVFNFLPFLSCPLFRSLLSICSLFSPPLFRSLLFPSPFLSFLLRFFF